jgi:CRISPR-associated Csx11 family protein
MGELNLENLKKYEDEILKAEIGALLFNLGKTHVGSWHEKNGQNYWNINFGISDEEKFKTDFKSKFGYLPFSNYKGYHKIANETNKTPFEYETEKSNLKDFIFNHKVSFPFEKEFDWIIFFKGDALKENEDGEDFIKKIFFRGCENINSGIDKGSPKEQLKGNLWISNAFGSFKKNVELQDFDDARICFYNKFHNFLSSNNYYVNPNWQEIRRFVFTEVKNWYSKLLSDSRFPVNDVTLWDQAYMTATMFKAVLAQLCMNSSNLEKYMDNPSSIKWCILGIQYDKLALAEKGYKPQQIQWYREVSNEVDDEIKKLLEYDYPIGNEIYRDETGIYFLVGEDLGEDLKDDSNLAKLKSDLEEINDKITDIFKEKTFDELYPAIFLTKPSRGLMNLPYLLEEAKENFLKADWSKKQTDICIEKSESGRAIGICQVCGQRLIFKSDRRNNDDKNICDVCFEKKTRGRIDKWLEDTSKETIWMDELKDTKDRVALVTMKFELHDWLNGDMLNSMIVRNETFKRSILWVKNFILLLLSNLDVSEYFDVKEIERNIAELSVMLKSPSTPPEEKSKLGKKKGTFETLKRNIEKIKGLIENLRQSKWWEEPLNNKIITSRYQNTIEELAEMIKNEYEKIRSEFKVALLENFSFFPKYLAAEAYIGCKNNDESFDDFIRQIFFGSIIGTHWEEWIKKNGLNSKIDWDKEIIKWNHLTDDDIEFLSILILQFLIRKNPSPARLRRIWESTQEFFEDIKKNICAYADIPDKRRKRYFWEDIKINGKDEYIPDGEYYDGEAVFWANKGKVYLISYIKDLTSDPKFNLKRYEDKKDIGVSLNLSAAKTEDYQPYISIIDPTPISWQFIIPAEYVPNLIDNVMKKYNENFKFVYGKLPLHIGVVVQDYKKPLYVGIKALRKIRRDVEAIEKLSIEEKPSKVREILKCQKIEESLNNTHKYYSLYWGNPARGYKFYI